jgi:hypothetical protein
LNTHHLCPATKNHKCRSATPVAVPVQLEFTA